MVLGFDTYALQLQDVDLDLFNGQFFAVNLGSVEDALQSEGSFSEALSTSEKILKLIENTTASVQLPNNTFDRIPECENTTALQRLSYSVFLSDILFQSQRQVENALDIGSIIVTIRLSCAENASLSIPILIHFQTIEQV